MKSKITLILFAALVASSFATSGAQAASRNYSLAGCGWGSQVMGKDGSQVLASTTNGTSGNQTFGITFGTSNCTDDGMVTARAKIPAFVETNRAALATDVARGSGQTVAGLSEVLGCDQPARLATVLQARYKEIFSQAQSADVTQSIVDVARSTPGLSCQIVI